MKRKFTEQMLKEYEKHLVRAEMSTPTIREYLLMFVVFTHFAV